MTILKILGGIIAGASLGVTILVLLFLLAGEFPILMALLIPLMCVFGSIFKAGREK